MDVALVAILLILAPLSMSAPTEVPVVEEFHNAMMNSYNNSDGMMFNTEDKDVVDALNVTSDTVIGYPQESKDFFDDVGSGENDGRNLAAVMVPYVILFVAVFLAILGPICGCCCMLGKRIAKWRRQRGSNVEVRPDVIVVVHDNEPEADATRPKDNPEDCVYSINVASKTEYVPHGMGYFI